MDNTRIIPGFFVIMEPQQNVGSFANAIGGSPELIEAMQRRNLDVSALQQTSPGSVQGTEVPPPIDPTMTSGISSAQAALPQGAPTQPAPPDSDVTLAMKALSTVVVNDSKMKRDLVSLRSQGTI